MAQRSITSFFKPSNCDNISAMAKRKTSEISKNSKKLKLDENAHTGTTNTKDNKNLQNETTDQLTNQEKPEVLKSEVAQSGKLDASKQVLEKSSKKIELASEKILNSSIGKSWYDALKTEFEQPYFKKLSEFVTAERIKNKIFPSEEDVFSWTRTCDVEDVKVVILGQDPYHGPGQAHVYSLVSKLRQGKHLLCSYLDPGEHGTEGLMKINLRNMYKELEKDIEGFKNPGHGYLLGWANQGVLLLNAVLTVRSGNANSHKDQGWEKFTTAVIRTVAENNKGVVFFLWGAYAQKKCADIKDKASHHLLSSVHPSPLSASRGFFGSKHFSQCNELLKKEGKEPIHWSHLPVE